MSDEEYVTPENLDRLKDLMKRVGESDSKIQKALTASSIDPETYSDLMELYTVKASQVATRDEFYPYEELNGEIQIGQDLDGRPVSLTREQLNEHLLAVSMTGRGKTTFFYNLIGQLNLQNLPFWVFDFKNDYRHLTKHYEDVVVINWTDLKFNPLEPPPGVTASKWGEVISDVYAHSTDLLLGSESYFMDKLAELYRIFDAENMGRYPSLYELRELIESEKISPASPWYQYSERNLGRLSILTGFSGKIFNCSSGLPLDELLDRKVVFELKEPNQYVTSFFVETVLTWLFYYRDAMGHRQEMKHAVLFDEAKRVFDINRERQPESGWPPIDDLVGKVREFGEAVIVADHEPSKLTDSLMANTNVKIWMSLGSGKDINEMARVFGLDSDEVDYTRTMEKGNALLKIADKNPVPIVLPDYTLEKDVTEEEVKKAMEPELKQLGWKERYRPEEFLVYIGKGEEEKPTISQPAKQLLISIRNSPLMGISERYKMLGFGSKKGNAAKDELVQEGFVSEVEIRAGKKGRNPKLLEITKEGRQLLESMGYRVRFKSKGGVEHQFWQKEVQKYYLKQGYDAFIEHYIGERSIDVYAVKKNEKIAVEIALSPEHELENVKKCLKEGFDQVQIVYVSRRVRDKIKRSVEEKFGEIPEKILFSDVKDFK